MDKKTEEVNWMHIGLAALGGAVIGFVAGVAAGPTVMEAIDPDGSSSMKPAVVK